MSEEQVNPSPETKQEAGAQLPPETPPQVEETLEKITEIKRLPDADLTVLARDLKENKFFSSAHLKQEGAENDIGSVFMPLMLGALQNYTPEALNDVGLVYEYYDQAGPRSINGFPSFFSFRILHIEDWKIVFERFGKLVKAEEAAMSAINQETIKDLSNEQKPQE